MDRAQLEKKLEQIPANPNFYSLDGKAVPDRLVLDSSGSHWIVFYFDERGGRHDERLFNTESEACEYIYKHFVELRKRYGV